MAKKERIERIVTNKHMSLFFFCLFLVFFFLFVGQLGISKEAYSMNIVMAFFCLQFSLAFKTWQLIRGEE